MVENGIIGRKYEQELIAERCESGKAELIAVYGRRRVGKTFLIRRMFNDQFAFSFTGMYDVSRAAQLEQFRLALQQYSGQSVPRLKDWFEAFHALRERMSSFHANKKALLHTFITTYGVKRNMHSGLVNSEVKLDDLFEG